MPLARTMLIKDEKNNNNLYFIDDNPFAKIVNRHPVLSYDEFNSIKAENRYIAIAIADGKTREKISKKIQRDGGNFWSIYANNIVIMDDVIIGDGSILSPFVTLTSNIITGKHFHANLYSYVEHDCIIGDFVTFAPAVKCNGNVVIEDHAYIGTGAMIKQGKPGKPLVIGKGAIVGMGAVVTKDVAPGITVVGNPARQLMKS